MESTLNFIESLSRRLTVLSVPAQSPAPLSLTELADQVGLSRSTMQRLTHTLLHLGYLDRDEETKKYRPGKRLDAVLERIALDPFTPQTITAKAGLREELKRVRLQGFAANDEELVTGLRSVAAPVRNFTGEVIAAVNIAVPSERVSMKKLRTFFARRVLETAGAISFILGHEAISGRRHTGIGPVLSGQSFPAPQQR